MSRHKQIKVKLSIPLGNGSTLELLNGTGQVNYLRTLSDSYWLNIIKIIKLNLLVDDLSAMKCELFLQNVFVLFKHQVFAKQWENKIKQSIQTLRWCLEIIDIWIMRCYIFATPCII